MYEQIGDDYEPELNNINGSGPADGSGSCALHNVQPARSNQWLLSSYSTTTWVELVT